VLRILLGCCALALAIITSRVTTTMQGLASGDQPRQITSQPLVHRELAARDQKSSEPQQAMDRADRLRTDWTKVSLQEAIELYEKAALIWTSASEFASASQANLNAGDLYFVFSEYSQALKRYRNTEALADKSGDWLLKAAALSRMGRLRSFIGNNELAQRHLTKALDLFKQHEANRNEIAANAYGEALSNLAEVSYAKGDFVKAREQLNSALEVFHSDPTGEAKVHLFSAFITGSIGDSERAVGETFRALDLYRQANDRIGEGLALSTLGLAHSLKRDVTRATELHKQAIDIFRTAGDRYNEGIALTALGQVYESIDDLPLATHQYDQALRLFEDIGAVDGVAVTTFKLGKVHQRSGQPDQAVAFFERCLQLSRASRKIRTEINALSEIANVYASQKRQQLASQQYQKIQKFFEAVGDKQGQATALNGHADLLLQLGQNQRALEVCLRALPLSEKASDKGILASTLYNLARANLALGSLEVALVSIRRSLEIIEELRGNVASPEFRLSYLSGFRKHFELCIEILMQLDRQRPGQGFAADALLVSEQARARLLRDLISESRINLRQAAATPLVLRERELRELFRVQAQYRMDLILGRRNADEIAAVDNQLDQLRAEYQHVQAQFRQQNPRLFTTEQASSLTLQQIQNELRDDDTMLLEYELGDERSYLWTVTANSLESYQLPARKIIEEASRELYTLITTRQGSEGRMGTNYQSDVEAADNAYSQKAATLSQMLLGPLAGQLGYRRLVIVTEGALQYIPFDALPGPIAPTPSGASRTLLITTNEVAVLPSVSALIAIRTASHRKTSPAKLVAVLADPVLSSTDDRLRSETVSRDNPLAASEKKSHHSRPQAQMRNGGLGRLIHASEEADAISAAAPWGTTMVVKGLDASRETAMRPDVAQYQILHFATHGILDNENPELSGIVLSSVDQNGKATNGLMPLQDIYSLNLSAELIVLSACQTALGKEIKGEGLIGLTHSFMSAGAKSVVASLWKVDDRATAILMADFYQSMFQQGMSPAAALRTAKLKMMRDPHRNAPYYWAGFVLQGEYVNRIRVERHSSLRLSLTVLFGLIFVALFGFRRRRERRSRHRTRPE